MLFRSSPTILQSLRVSSPLLQKSPPILPTPAHQGWLLPPPVLFPFNPLESSLLCSREVPCSALKGETVPDSLPATPKGPPTRFWWRGGRVGGTWPWGLPCPGLGQACRGTGSPLQAPHLSLWWLPDLILSWALRPGSPPGREPVPLPTLCPGPWRSWTWAALVWNVGPELPPGPLSQSGCLPPP